MWIFPPSPSKKNQSSCLKNLDVDRKNSPNGLASPRKSNQDTDFNCDGPFSDQKEFWERTRSVKNGKTTDVVEEDV